MKKIVLIIFAAIAVVSCRKDDEIDMTRLQEYKFVFEAYRNPDDSTTDEFIYSFDADSMTVFGPRYEYVNNVRIPVDTVTERWSYFVDGNKIVFPPIVSDDLIINEESISPVAYRWFFWKVLSFDDLEMKIDILGNSKLFGHAEFRVEK